MRRSVLFVVAIWLCFALTSYVTAQQPRAESAQKQALPQFRIGTPYRLIRTKLIKLGWQPVTLPSATPCGDDDRCRGFHEVYFCAGAGNAQCIYTWKKKATLIRVYAEREADQTYTALRPCPLHPTKNDDGFACESETITANERKADTCAFCGTWNYDPNKSYLKISQAGTGKFKIVEGACCGRQGRGDFDQNTGITWHDDPVRNADGIYLKMLNGRLEGRFVTSNFHYATGGRETTYKITCELTSNNKMRYSVWSAITGKTLTFVPTKIGN